MARSKDHGKRWSHASHAHAERTHQRRVSTVGTDATTVALVATAFTRFEVQKVSMQDVTIVPLVGSNLSLEIHRVFFAKQSLEKAVLIRASILMYPFKFSLINTLEVKVALDCGP